MGTFNSFFDVFRGLNPFRDRELPVDSPLARERARRMST